VSVSEEDRRRTATGRRAAVSGRIAGLVLVLLGAGPAQAQYAAACPPPKKLAAGACVAVCPGGYEDQGRVCVYRNTSR
jgi:hypothetical protein